jgi:hypothetical protein
MTQRYSGTSGPERGPPTLPQRAPPGDPTTHHGPPHRSPRGAEPKVLLIMRMATLNYRTQFLPTKELKKCVY